MCSYHGALALDGLNVELRAAEGTLNPHEIQHRGRNCTGIVSWASEHQVFTSIVAVTFG